MANFPPVLVAAALVGAADKPWLTALAIVATGIGGAVLVRRRTDDDLPIALTIPGGKS